MVPTPSYCVDISYPWRKRRSFHTVNGFKSLRHLREARIRHHNPPSNIRTCGVTTGAIKQEPPAKQHLRQRERRLDSMRRSPKRNCPGRQQERSGLIACEERAFFPLYYPRSSRDSLILLGTTVQTTDHSVDRLNLDSPSVTGLLSTSVGMRPSLPGCLLLIISQALYQTGELRCDQMVPSVPNDSLDMASKIRPFSMVRFSTIDPL